jgi:hypothetical protein
MHPGWERTLLLLLAPAAMPVKTPGVATLHPNMTLLAPKAIPINQLLFLRQRAVRIAAATFAAALQVVHATISHSHHFGLMAPVVERFLSRFGQLCVNPLISRINQHHTNWQTLYY